MNALTLPESQPLELANPSALMLSTHHMQSLVSFADMMAKSSITVPDHLKGKPSDCLAIAMQAMQWGMNPFAVAQKTHVVSGRLGYEAQLVNAVIQASGFIVGTFSYEYQEPGKVEDIRCRVGAMPKGSDSIVWGEWLRNGDVTVRNSPLWKVNPKQQLGYLQVKNWARLYCPGAILGVYTDDELGDIEQPAARRGPQRRSAAPSAPAPAPLVEEVPKAEQQRQQQAGAAPAAEPAKASAPAASPAAAGAQGGAGISGGQVAYLRNKLKQAGIEESSICDRFQVTGIELMSSEQFDTIKAELLAMT